MLVIRQLALWLVITQCNTYVIAIDVFVFTTLPYLVLSVHKKHKEN